jgi:hypothetical protein
MPHPRPRAARKPLVALAVLVGVAAGFGACGARGARADESKGESKGADELPRLLLDDGRIPPSAAESGLLRFTLHGEYQLRINGMQSFPLDISATQQLAHPGATTDSLGQNTWVNHWFRITPRLQIGDKVQVVGQMDILTGVLMGNLAHDSYADQTPRDAKDGFSNAQPRWLYLDWLTKYGLWRVGQMPNHWGMGILANDGDHPSVFGDYRYGSIGDGILFGTKPLGKDGPLTVALGAQYVFKDPLVDLSRGDRAVQGILAAYLEKGPNQVGVYGVYRHQWNDRTSDNPPYTYTDALDIGVADVAAKFAAPVVGNDAWVTGAAEGAFEFGYTDEIRTTDHALSGENTTVRAYGGAAQLAVVHVGRDTAAGSPAREPSSPSSPPSSPVDWGDVVGSVEVGYASGNANPYGDTQKRFTFDPNHHVGLLLFDEVMRWQTARAAVAAQDPNLSNGARPTPGVNLIPSNGGIFGAEYINPTAIVRPRPWLDLKAGMVIAQATADVVDPYRTAIYGSSQNYLGGNPARHDLGVELDGGFEARIALEFGLKFVFGAQAGVLFPGGALEDASGNKMRDPWIVVGRLGFLF